MLSVSITILTVVLVIISIFLILIVLMQRPKQEGLGAAFGGGMMNEALGAHTTDILQKATVWFSVIFFAASIVLAILKTNEIKAMKESGVLKGIQQEQLPPTPQPSMLDFPNTPGDPSSVPESGPAVPPAGEGGKAPKIIDDGTENAKGDSGDAPKAGTPVEKEPGKPVEEESSAGGKPKSDTPKGVPDGKGGASKGEATPE